ncbi:MAG: hypothetical protein K0R98_1054 [Rickettsiaceae bacterium]|jgi:hypothetical protein|nr:hypothetical protein [Rickettsiaceae bacterium]
MSHIINKKPNYDFWARKEKWSIQEAALLLHDIEPHGNDKELLRNLSLAQINQTAELETKEKAIVEAYLLLKEIAWKQCAYSQSNYNPHPFDVISQAERKKLLNDISPELMQFLQERHLHEFGKPMPKQVQTTTSSNQTEAVEATSSSGPEELKKSIHPSHESRSRNTFLKIITALVYEAYHPRITPDGHFARGTSPMIEKSLHKIGQYVTDQTILNILEECSPFLEMVIPKL